MNDKLYPWMVILVLPLNSCFNPYIYCWSRFFEYLKARNIEIAVGKDELLFIRIFFLNFSNFIISD